MVAVPPNKLADLLGAVSTARGGPLELVFLNGCSTEDLGLALRAAGIPEVLCWSTPVEHSAAAIFSKAFFDAKEKDGMRTAAAFEHAKLAVEQIPKPGNDSSRFVPKYLLEPPDLGSNPPGLTLSGSFQAGVPKLLIADEPLSNAETANSAATTCFGALASAAAALAHLASRAVGQAATKLVGLLMHADGQAKALLQQRYFGRTLPLTLEELRLNVGDTILCDVTMDWWQSVEWRATLVSNRNVEWDARPDIDAQLYAQPYQGHVRFVLTLDGQMLYDEDERLYYSWRRADSASHRPATAGADAPPTTLRVVAYIVRGVTLLLLLAALLWTLHALVLYVLPLAWTFVCRPLTSCCTALVGIVAYSSVRVAYREMVGVGA